ncbi:MAG: hypothetical protein ACR2LO_05205, partial [Ilumatobacteraceae bacterium]
MEDPFALVAAESTTYAVYGLIALLAVLGIAMVIVTVWLVRMTKPEHDSLSALDVMGSRRFRTEGTRARERRLAATHETADDALGATAVMTGSAGAGTDAAADADDEAGDPDATGAVEVV